MGLYSRKRMEARNCPPGIGDLKARWQGLAFWNLTCRRSLLKAYSAPGVLWVPRPRRKRVAAVRAMWWVALRDALGYAGWHGAANGAQPRDEKRSQAGGASTNSNSCSSRRGGDALQATARVPKNEPGWGPVGLGERNPYLTIYLSEPRSGG